MNSRERYRLVSEGPLWVVVGPTATGKSTLAARLASEVGGEIVSADSVQVYRYFDIGSGKPSEEELALAPHHLIDVRDPLEPLEASVFAELAREAIEEIRSRGKVPIVCGGTFLWVRALIYGLADAPAGDEGIRERHRKWAEAEGRGALHAELQKVDPKSAARLHENDLIRVSRALEVFELSGKTLSAIQAEHGFREAHYDATLISLDWERESYDERLALRVRKMVEAGWVPEVRSLLERGYGAARAMDAVGYRQVRAHVESPGELNAELLIEEVVRITRVFARRQRTWLRDEPQLSAPVGALEDDSALRELIERLPNVRG